MTGIVLMIYYFFAGSQYTNNYIRLMKTFKYNS